MRVIELLDYLKANIPFTYYPNGFAASTPDQCAVVRIIGGGSPTIHVARPSFQLLIRDTHPSTAEAKAWEIFDYFNQKTDFIVGSTKIVYCVAQQSTPIYIGTDESGRAIYSINFNCITDL